MNKPLWLTLVGVLEPGLTRAFVLTAAGAIQQGHTDLHILVQSPGGATVDGVFLHNFIKSIPIPVTTYNLGHVGSAANLVYLAAADRVVADTATFMLHRVRAAPTHDGTVQAMLALATTIGIDEANTEAIFKRDLRLTPQQREVFAVADLVLNAEQALACGLATRIGLFAPGTPLISV